HMVGQAYTELSKVHTGQGNADQRRPIDKTGTPGRQVRMSPASPGIRQGSGNRNGQTASGRSAHHMLNSHITPGQEGDGQGAATDSEQSRSPANTTAHDRQTRLAGNITGRFWLDAKAHLDRDRNSENPDNHLQGFTASGDRSIHSNRGSNHASDRRGPERVKPDRSPAVVRPHRADRSKNKGCQGGSY